MDDGAFARVMLHAETLSIFHAHPPNTGRSPSGLWASERDSNDVAFTFMHAEFTHAACTSSVLSHLKHAHDCLFIIYFFNSEHIYIFPRAK